MNQVDVRLVDDQPPTCTMLERQLEPEDNPVTSFGDHHVASAAAAQASKGLTRRSTALHI